MYMYAYVEINQVRRLVFDILPKMSRAFKGRVIDFFKFCFIALALRARWQPVTVLEFKEQTLSMSKME